ncbi:hypothetical protein CR513_07694, partial [Mucuna pruriens]
MKIACEIDSLELEVAIYMFDIKFERVRELIAGPILFELSPFYLIYNQDFSLVGSERRTELEREKKGCNFCEKGLPNDDRLKLELEHLPKWLLTFLLVGTKEGLTSAPKQRLGLILNEGMAWQLLERNVFEGEDDLDPREVDCLQNGVVMSLESPNTSLEHVQNVRDRFDVLCISFCSGLASGSFTNVTMPCLQRGQAIEPGGPDVLVEVEFVEHRYKAHCVQNS